MSFASLLDHQARVWRLDETLGDHRETVHDRAPVYDSVPCTLKRMRAVLSDAGPGLVPSGERTVYFLPAVTLEQRDVVELISGPDAPATLEVESSSKPRGHHVEARCTEFHGKLPELGS
jgi:hypothetical protein